MLRRVKLALVVVGLVGLGASVAFASSAFTDLDEDRYYADAVAWAGDNGVTTGTSESTFSPGDPATRAQSVTFAYRYDQNVVQPALDGLADEIAALETLGELSCGATQVVIDDGGWRCADLVLTRHYLGATNRELVTDGESGDYSSVAIGADGNPVISHVDEEDLYLELYVCGDPACMTGTNRTLVDDGYSDRQTSVAIGADGNPVISHQNDGYLELYVCDDPACTTGTNRYELVTPLDVWSGYYSSVAIGADGNPVISHQNELESGDSTLDLYVCGDPACMTGTNRTLVDDGYYGYYSSVAIGADGNPVISHQDEDDYSLDLYVCGDPACTTGTNRTLVDDGYSGYYSSVAIGADGNPVISHHNDDDYSLDLYVCGDPACTTGTNRNLVDDGYSGYYSSVAIGADGNPVISHHNDDYYDLELYICADPACTAGTNHRLTDADNDGNEAGQYSSVAIGADGNPVISHQDDDNFNLEVAIVVLAVTGVEFE